MISFEPIRGAETAMNKNTTTYQNIDHFVSEPFILQLLSKSNIPRDLHLSSSLRKHVQAMIRFSV